MQINKEKIMDENAEPKKTFLIKKLKQIFAVLTIIVILATPYLLVVDMKRFAPVVALVWMYSVIYYIFIKRKK